MIGYILLRGKDFSLPDDVSTAIVGIFFGLVCGLFYYQHYYRTYYWWFSIGGGLLLTYICQKLIERPSSSDDASIVRTIASFAVPFILMLLLNQALYFVKHSKRKRRKRVDKKTHSDLFNAMPPSALPLHK